MATAAEASGQAEGPWFVALACLKGAALFGFLWGVFAAVLANAPWRQYETFEAKALYVANAGAPAAAVLTAYLASRALRSSTAINKALAFGVPIVWLAFLLGASG